MTRSVDFPAAAQAVCTEIWGRPTAKYATHWRFGNRQSKSLHLETGRITDFETDWKGGVLDVLQQYGGCRDRAAAWRWLEVRGLAQPRDPSDPTPTPVLGASATGGTRLDQECKQPAPPPALPFHVTDLPRVDYLAIPDDPDHALNRWATTKCSRPRDAPWPAGCRWLRGWWGGDSVMVPLARPEGFLRPDGLPRTAVMGIHAVHVTGDGRPREHDGLNKRIWNGKRAGSTAGCGYLAGHPGCNGTLALCEGVADALAVHWHLGIPALAACGSLAGLAASADELAQLTCFPLNLTLQIWPDQDTRANWQTGLRAGPAGALALHRALRAAGAADEQITIMAFGRPDQDPCDWLADSRRTTPPHGKDNP